MVRKVYVEVVAKIGADGAVTPLSIRWEDGEKYAIDRVLRVDREASRRAGGIGTRYVCRIRGRETCIWNEGSRWFVEGKSDG